MKQKKSQNTFPNISIWRSLVNFWTVILYSLILIDFFAQNRLTEFLGPISAIYIAILALYTAQKEFERWNDYNVGRHPGEIYVYVWTVLVVSLFVLEAIYQNGYKLPSEVFTTYVVVLGVLAVTRKSKNTYNSKRWDNL